MPQDNSYKKWKLHKVTKKRLCRLTKHRHVQQRKHENMRLLLSWMWEICFRQDSTYFNRKFIKSIGNKNHWSYWTTLIITEYQIYKLAQETSLQVNGGYVSVNQTLLQWNYWPRDMSGVQQNGPNLKFQSIPKISSILKHTLSPLSEIPPRMFQSCQETHSPFLQERFKK